MTVQKIAETLCNDFIKGKIKHELLPRLSVQEIVRNNFQDIIFYLMEKEKLERLEYLFRVANLETYPFKNYFSFQVKKFKENIIMRLARHRDMVILKW